MEKKGIVYAVTNKETKKTYVGVTTKSLEERKKDHLKKSKKGKSYAFQHAIATYGPKAFNWQQVYAANSIDELAQKEKAYILKYNSKEEGYNSDSGGGIQKTVYQYDLKGNLINTYSSLSSAGYAFNVVKSSIGKACNGVTKICKGYVWSYSSSLPISFQDQRKKVVQQFSIGGKFITEYKSVSEASKLTGFNKTSIAKVCRGERKSCGGFNWSFK